MRWRADRTHRLPLRHLLLALLARSIEDVHTERHVLRPALNVSIYRTGVGPGQRHRAARLQHRPLHLVRQCGASEHLRFLRSLRFVLRLLLPQHQPDVEHTLLQDHGSEENGKFFYCEIFCYDVNYVHIDRNSFQSTQQGILQMSGSAARLVGPMMISQLYVSFGPRASWLLEIVVLGAIVATWLIFYRRMVPLKLPQQSVKSEVSSVDEDGKLEQVDSPDSDRKRTTNGI